MSAHHVTCTRKLRRSQIEMQMAPGTFYAAMVAGGTGLWGAGTSKLV